MLLRFLMVIFILIGTLQSEEIINSQKTVKTKLLHIKQYYELENSINKSIKSLGNVGFLWTSKGLLYLYDYKFNDGYIKADYKKAENCFRKAVLNSDNFSYYFLASSLYKQGKITEALNVSDERLKTLSSVSQKSKQMQKDYNRLSLLYAGIVLDKSLNKVLAQKAITYLFEHAYIDKNVLAQLEVGLLYKFLQKNKQANYFISEACISKSKTKNNFVNKYCDKNIEVYKKKCESCEMKKRLELI